uniref:Uncharacterized protein n=1 Tax=Avena sativa TaxID=4498 RepID=A0ACD5XHD3_AVESA
MCGIALVLSGDRLVVAPSTAAAAAAASGTRFPDEREGVSVGELEEALRRRGPDSLGCHSFHLCADGTVLGDDGDGVGGGVGATELCFIGATLQLRGAEPVSQPLVGQSGSVLVYNGEIYGGIHIANDQNDTQSLFSSLESCCSCDLCVVDRDETYPCCENVGKSVPQILSTIRGPWALIYWQAASNTLWFGRDAFGRRSLLVHWPTPDDSRFILSSVSPPSFSRNNSASEVNGLDSATDPDFSGHTKVSYWEELPFGSGADEQCAGYGRHRTKYRLGGWSSLDEEMRLDVQRIWKRNMGRDDRCISDHGKEARFPFLDENVIQTLLEIPLWEIAKLDEPVGKGDKKILRQVAKLLGLQEASFLPKRAIQFGSRIARESNRKNFGSNRAANQASAGSVEVHKLSH